MHTLNLNQSIERMSFDDHSVLLTKVNLTLASAIPNCDPTNLTVSTRQDACLNALIMRLTATLASKHWSEGGKITTENTYTEVPHSWIDSFRLEYIPNFLTSIFPIKYRSILISNVVRTESTNNYWIFPEVPTSISPNENFIIQGVLHKFKESYING